MTKVVVYALLATAFVVLIAFGPSKHNHRRNHVSLSRRLGNKYRASSYFDPLIAKIQRQAEEKGLGDNINPYDLGKEALENIEQEYEYFNDDGKLNLTLRLITLFPSLDKSPEDGVVSLEELQAWVRQQGIERLNCRTHEELVSQDKNEDGLISFNEYLPQIFDEHLERNSTEHGQAGWWKQQFVNADSDDDGFLSFDEFKDFLYPEDSDNVQIQKWLLAESIERMDYDNDGKLNYMEFCENAYTIYKSVFELRVPGAHMPSAEEKFTELDVDKDKLLTVEEMRPLLPYLHPGELSTAKDYAALLIDEADDDRDGKLTLEEMLNHKQVFYTTFYDDGGLDNMEEVDYHQEL